MGDHVTRFSALILIFFGVHAEAAPPQKVKICLHQYREELASAAVLIAEKNGYFADEQVAVELKTFSTDLPEAARANLLKTSQLGPNRSERSLNMALGGIEMVKETERGNCDYTSTAFEALLWSEKLNQVKVKVSYLYGQNYDTHLLVAKDSPITSINDLKGKTIRIGQVGTQLALDRILTTHGLKLADVRTVYGAPDTLPASLKNGKIDALIAYNPTTPLLLAGNWARILEPKIFSKYLPPYVPHSVLITNREFESKNPQLAAKVMKAIKRAAEHITKNTDSLVTAMKLDSRKIGLARKFEMFDPVTVEKSAAFAQIGKPFFNDEQGGPLSKAEVIEACEKFRTALKSRGFLAASEDHRISAFYE